jgi:hypothetical protein
MGTQVKKVKKALFFVTSPSLPCEKKRSAKLQKEQKSVVR